MEQPIKTTDKDGTQEWWLDGKWHRDDGPAWIRADGAQAWHQHGKIHRDDGPAFIGDDGYQVWYQYGKRHRIDGPAWIEANGTKEYWLNDTQLKEGSLALRLIKERERRREAQDGTSS